MTNKKTVVEGVHKCLIEGPSMRKFVFAVCLLAAFLLTWTGVALPISVEGLFSTEELLPTPSGAEWSIDCANFSCRATAGELALYWSGDTDSGNLTSVVLPISEKDVASIEKAASATLEKVLPKGMDARIRSDGKDATLRFFKHFTSTLPMCETRGTQVARWMCAAEWVLEEYKAGRIRDTIYACFLDEGLKYISTLELERLVVNSGAKESGDIALYLACLRLPILFNRLPLYDSKQAILTLKAFYTYPRNPVKAYDLSKTAAFVGYLVEKGLMERPAEYSVLVMALSPELLVQYERYWGEFERKVRMKRLVSYAVKGAVALFILAAVRATVLRKRETLIQTLKDVKARVLARLRKEVP